MVAIPPMSVINASRVDHLVTVSSVCKFGGLFTCCNIFPRPAIGQQTGSLPLRTMISTSLSVNISDVFTVASYTNHQRPAEYVF